MGDEVKFTGLINIPPHIADRMHEIDWTSGMLNLAYFLGLVSKQDAVDLTFFEASDASGVARCRLEAVPS